MYPIKQSSTAQKLLFLLVDSSDHVTGKTGLSPTVTLSKNGAAFAAPSGAVSELANGWYVVAGNATDTGTLGPLALHATGSGADPTDVLYYVVAYNPQAVLAVTGDAMALTTGERTSVADALLDRNMATGTDSGSASVRTVRQALRFLRNKWDITGGTLTVRAEDDSTAAWTATVSTASGNPVTSIDPA